MQFWMTLFPFPKPVIYGIKDSGLVKAKTFFIINELWDKANCIWLNQRYISGTKK
jgi:hypothetical protein